MALSKRKVTLILLVGLVFGFSACTEAKRWLDDKPAAKASPTPQANDPSVALKSSPSPTGSQSPKATTAAVFSGDIAGKAGKRLLYQLLEKNNQKPIKLDMLLSDEQLEQLNDVDKGRKWYFDLAYQGEDGYNTGGELLIDIGKGKGDLKLNGNHLTGNIIVTSWTGPRQGLMSIGAKPAGNEPPPAKEPKTAPSQSKKNQSAANNPPS